MSNEPTYSIWVRWPWGAEEICDIPASRFFIGDNPAYRGGPAYDPSRITSFDHVTLDYHFPDPMPVGTPDWLIPATGKTLEVLLVEVGVKEDRPLFEVSRIERPEDLND
jgi:hypothetical protein